MGERHEPEETHRGAFGEYGGEERGLIDRSFRERIVLVGVIREGQSEEEVDEALLRRLLPAADSVRNPGRVFYLQGAG